MNEHINVFHAHVITLTRRIPFPITESPKYKKCFVPFTAISPLWQTIRYFDIQYKDVSSDLDRIRAITKECDFAEAENGVDWLCGTGMT